MAEIDGFIAIKHDHVRVDSIAAVFEDRNGPMYAGARKGVNILFTSGEKAYYESVFASEVVDMMKESTRG